MKGHMKNAVKVILAIVAVTGAVLTLGFIGAADHDADIPFRTSLMRAVVSLLVTVCAITIGELINVKDELEDADETIAEYEAERVVPTLESCFDESENFREHFKFTWIENEKN